MFGYKLRKKEYCYQSASKTPYRISRSKIDLFIECPRCFYLDQRMGVPRPSGFPFTLNNAVDELLKREFDSYRDAETAHPLMKEYGIDAVPFKHEKMEEWRDAMRRGVQFLHEPTLSAGVLMMFGFRKTGSFLLLTTKQQVKKVR